MRSAHDLGVSIYHDGSRSFQDRFDTRRLADRIEERIVHDDDRRRTTARSSRRATCSSSPRPTRTARRSARTRAATPASSACSTSTRSRSRATTATACSSRSATSLANPRVGLLFVDFDGQKRLRLNGIASIDAGRPAAGRVPAGAVRRPRPRDRGLPELPALHPQAGSSSSARASRRARRASRRCRTGSGATGRATCCPPAIPRTSG